MADMCDDMGIINFPALFWFRGGLNEAPEN